MATFLDLKKEINQVLKKNFHKVKIYSSEVKEGFKRDSFFTHVIPLNSENETVNFASHKVMVVISYFSKNRTELENLKMDVDLRNAFGMNLKVNRRSFLLKNIRSEITDGVLQFRFNLDYLVGVNRKKNLEEVDYELMQNIDLDLKRRD